MLKMEGILCLVSYVGTKIKNSSTSSRNYDIIYKQSYTMSPFNLRGCDYFLNQTTLDLL